MYSLFMIFLRASAVQRVTCKAFGFYAMLLDLAISQIGEGMSVLRFLEEGQMSDSKRPAYVLRKSKGFFTLVSKIFRTYDFSIILLLTV